MDYPGRNIAHSLLHLLGLQSAVTQTSEPERTALSKHAAGKKSAAEIGVFEGVNTTNIARAMDADGKIVGVDLFPQGKIGFCWGEQIAWRELRRAGVADKVRFERGCSWEVGKSLKDEQFDLLFIDADHTYEALENDWNAWTPMLEVGGLVALHDVIVSDFCPKVAVYGSHKFYEAEVKHNANYELVDAVDSLAVLKKLA